MGRTLAYSLALFALAMTTGCASVSSKLAPEADLDSIESVYVQKLPADERGIERVISDQMNLLGYKSTYGPMETPPGPVDAIVTYQDKWMWDITMYMLELNIQIRDAEDRSVLARGKSYRPSLQRRSPEVMAEEVLAEIFKKNGKADESADSPELTAREQ